MSATLGKVQHDSELGRWQFVFGRPSAALRPYVRHYQGYIEEHSGLRRREVPRPDSSVIINLGAPLRVANPRSGLVTEHPRSFIAGLSDYHVVTETLGRAEGIQVSFTPAGASMFLGASMDTFAERVYDLADVLGPEADLLTEQIAGMASWQDRFDLVDAYVMRRFGRAKLPPAVIDAAYTAMLQSGGRVGMAALLRQSGWSERHFADQFRRYAGVSPKAMASIIRFNRALSMIESGETASLLDVVYLAGYYDQSHMVREFRRFAGASPTELTRRLIPDGAGVRDG